MRRDLAKFTDGPYIIDMIIPLTYVEAVARYQRLGYGDFPDVWAPQDMYDKWNRRLYTCRHWDEETRLCGDYANRPKMCSAYPYGNACERACGYEVPKEENALDDLWRWDAAEQGWRLTPEPKYTWDGQFLRETVTNAELPEEADVPSA